MIGAWDRAVRDRREPAQPLLRALVSLRCCGIALQKVTRTQSGAVLTAQATHIDYLQLLTRLETLRDSDILVIVETGRTVEFVGAKIQHEAVRAWVSPQLLRAQA